MTIAAAADLHHTKYRVADENGKVVPRIPSRSARTIAGRDPAMASAKDGTLAMVDVFEDVSVPLEIEYILCHTLRDRVRS